MQLPPTMDSLTRMAFKNIRKLSMSSGTVAESMTQQARYVE